MKRARVWAVDNIKVDLQGIGLRNLDFVRTWTGGGNLTQRRPIVVLLPRTTPDVARSALSETMPQGDEMQTVKVLLGKLHEGAKIVH